MSLYENATPTAPIQRSVMRLLGSNVLVWAATVVYPWGKGYSNKLKQQKKKEKEAWKTKTPSLKTNNSNKKMSTRINNKNPTTTTTTKVKAKLTRHWADSERRAPSGSRHPWWTRRRSPASRWAPAGESKESSPPLPAGTAGFPSGTAALARRLNYYSYSLSLGVESREEWKVPPPQPNAVWTSFKTLKPPKTTYSTS